MTILQALDRYYDRLAGRGDVVLEGYSVEPIGVVITLAHNGSVLDVAARRDPSGKKGKPERVPKWFGRAGTGSTPFFLWDNTAYTLGVSANNSRKTERDHEAFKALHRAALEDTQDPGLLALCRFLDRWTPDQFVEPLFKEEFLKFNVAFRLEGEQGLLHERPAAAGLIQKLRREKADTSLKKSKDAAQADLAFCLVTGKQLPTTRLHPKIKGVDGTASPEVPLVSFNEKAFESYGKSQGDNAPTSEVAAFRYTASLSRLLDRGTSRNRLKIGDATVAFWADASDVGEEAAAAAEDAFASLFNPASMATTRDDAAEAVKLRDMLDAVAKGRPYKRWTLGWRLVPGFTCLA